MHLRGIIAPLTFLILCAGPLHAEGPCKATTTTDSNGQKLILLENDYVALTIRPGTGGMVVSMVHKRTGFNYVGRTAGWFMDLDWSIPRQSNNDYQKQGYLFDLSESSPARVAVTLKGRSKIPPLDWIEVQKTLSLERNCSAIRASYRYFNHPDSMEPITVRPWIHHELGGLDLAARYRMPLRSGHYEIRPTTIKPRSKYGRTAAQGWLGVVVPGGNGLVAFPSLKDLHQYYEWVSAEIGTLEWRLRPLEVPNGEGYETSCLMLPFAGMRDLCGGADGVVCGMVLPDNIEPGKPVAWELELVAGRAQEKLTVDARARHLSDGVWKLLGERSCSLKPDVPAKLTLEPWTPDRPGTWVLQSRVSRGGKKLFDAERAIVLSKATEGYELALEGPREDDSNVVADPSAEWGSGRWLTRVGSVDETVAHSGRVSLKAEAVNHPEKRSIISQKEIPVEASTKYLISFWARCPVAKSFRINVLSLDENKKEIRPEPRECEVHFKERSWQWRRYEVPFETLPNAKFATMRFYGFGDNVTFWIDDVSMVPGEPKRRDKPGQTDIPYTLAVVTPHIPWARPYARGPVKAFLLAHNSSARDIAELGQRLEMEFQTVTTTGSAVHAPYASGTARGRRMDDELRNIQERLATRYEVIVLGGISWKWFTPKIRKALLKQLAAGAGLVYVQPNWLLDDLVDPSNCADPKFPEDLRKVDALFPLKWPGDGRYRHYRDEPHPYRAKAHPITDGIPFRVLVPMRYGNWGVAGEALAMQTKRHPLVSVGRYGKGRVVALNFVSGTWPYRRDGWEKGKQFQLCGLFPFYYYEQAQRQNYHYWEYHWALMARAVAWAAGKEPTVRVVAVEPDAGLQKLVQGPLEKVSIQLQSDRPVGGTLEFRLLDETSHVLAARKQKIALESGKAQPFEFATPENCPAGLIFAEFVLRDESGRSLNWAATAFEIPKPVQIEAIEFDRESKVYRRGESVTAKVKLSGKLEGAELRIQVFDSHDRVLLTKTVAATEETAVSFPLQHPRSVRMGVRAVLQGEKMLIDRAEARFTISPERGPWDQYQFVISGVRASRPYLYDAIYRIYTGLGFTCVRGYHDPFMNADHNYNYLASGPGFGHMKGKTHGDWGRYLQSGDLKHLHRDPPAYDEKRWQRTEKSLETHYATRGAQFVPLIYGLSDENNLGGGECDYDYSPSTLEWFRTWLREQYGDLVALNKQWQTDFATWEDVMPMPLPVAKKRGENLSPWADHREFMDYVFAQFHARMKAALRRGDPQAIVGVSGTQKPDAYNGYDWWQLMQVFDALLAYTRGNQPEIQRSFKRVPSVGWAGYGCVGPRVSAQLWRFLLYNKQASLWRDNLIIEPDWRISQSGRDYAEAVKPLLGGVGKLLIQSDWVSSPVGIHYSQASIRAAAGSKRASAFERARASWVRLVKDLGLQPAFVSYAQVEEGLLDPETLRVFILPESEAVSGREAEQLRRYVESGGLLIADTRLALRDKHCRLRPKAQLDDLFGIQRGKTDRERPPRRIEFRNADRLQWPHASLILGLADGATDISPTTGTPLAVSRDVPAFICNAAGKGRTVYLNCHLTSYAGGLEEGQKFRDNFRALLDTANLRPPCKVLDETGAPFYGCEVTEFRNGSERLLSLLADFGHFEKSGWETRPVVAKLAKKAWVYEVVTGKAYGYTDEVRLELPCNVMRILALLPGKVTGFALEGPRQAKPGDLLSFTLQVPAQPALRDRQLVRIETFGPDGQLRKAYSTTAWIPGSRGRHEIPLALNDTPGGWRIRASHIVSGMTAEKKWELATGNAP